MPICWDKYVEYKKNSGVFSCPLTRGAGEGYRGLSG